MHIYPIDATYKGNFRFLVKFSNNEIKEIDIKKVTHVDSRYGEFESFKVLQDENFVKNMKIVSHIDEKQKLFRLNLVHMSFELLHLNYLER